MAAPLTPLTAIRHFLLDMDGTLYLGKTPIAGAAAFVGYLRESGRRYLFITNNSSAGAAQYSRKLSEMGIPAAPRDILTSGEATARYLMSETSYRRVFAVGTPSFEQELTAAGLVVAQNAPEVVVLAFDTTLTYAKLERACLLLREGVPYIAANPDKVCPTDYGYIPDCGAMAALLYESTGRLPKFIGKPNPELARMGMAKLGAAREATAMVGDRLYTDMAMAYSAGLVSVLVLSGETTLQDVERADRKPDYVFASVRELHAVLASANGAASDRGAT